MKREILFRGKIKYNGNHLFAGDWAIGSLVLKSNGVFIYVIEEDVIEEDVIEEDEFGNITREYEVEVIPETIGQFTGLTDKNGVKIFEGDVIRYIEHNGYLLNSFAAIVSYDSLLAAFGYINNTQFMYYFSDFDEIDVDFLPHTEVIGNIHDNPNLIK